MKQINTDNNVIRNKNSNIAIADIMNYLPHRYPFLLVDKVLEMNEDISCVGIKNVTINEHFFQGHFPSNPVMPGVLMIEAMAQTAGLLCINYIGLTKDQLLEIYFLTINNAKFRKMVVPGDTLELHMQKIKRKKNIWWFNGKAKVNGKIACEAELGAMLAINDTK